MEDSLLGGLLSGLAGAVLTIIVSECIKHLYRRDGRKSLLRAIVSECRYTILILDEVANGTLNNRIPFDEFGRPLVKMLPAFSQSDKKSRS